MFGHHRPSLPLSCGLLNPHLSLFFCDQKDASSVSQDWQAADVTGSVYASGLHDPSRIVSFTGFLRTTTNFASPELLPALVAAFIDNASRDVFPRVAQMGLGVVKSTRMGFEAARDRAEVAARNMRQGAANPDVKVCLLTSATFILEVPLSTLWVAMLAFHSPRSALRELGFDEVRAATDDEAALFRRIKPRLVPNRCTFVVRSSAVFEELSGEFPTEHFILDDSDFAKNVDKSANGGGTEAAAKKDSAITMSIPSSEAAQERGFEGPSRSTVLSLSSASVDAGAVVCYAYSWWIGIMPAMFAVMTIVAAAWSFVGHVRYIIANWNRDAPITGVLVSSISGTWTSIIPRMRSIHAIALLSSAFVATCLVVINAYCWWIGIVPAMLAVMGSAAAALSLVYIVIANWTRDEPISYSVFAIGARVSSIRGWWTSIIRGMLPTAAIAVYSASFAIGALVSSIWGWWTSITPRTVPTAAIASTSACFAAGTIVFSICGTSIILRVLSVAAIAGATKLLHAGMPDTVANCMRHQLITSAFLGAGGFVSTIYGWGIHASISIVAVAVATVAASHVHDIRAIFNRNA
eukprot:TRINITY_DN8822_c0_g1_i1.p1 TRINITY_DN8822_c0_g1~~TRINITY_DN8822_c0_g1_i1.p1  ORF type:complete len:579 (+),score=0.30 TRINITY_DN8822_c0_g1_i1:925-2661(+)